jgi:DHA2 family multidrug resistance protein
MAAAPKPTSNIAPSSARPRHNPWLIALTVSLAAFMEVLDTSIANVALPHMAGGLSTSVDNATWVLTSYLVANAVVLPISGWFSAIFGRKCIYMVCVAIFTVSSLLCGMASSIAMLILFRIIQGAGGGGLQPISQAILADTFPRERLGMAFAIYGMAVVVAPAIGPTLGGWITDNYQWRWIFFINIPIGILSLILTSLLVQDPHYLRERVKQARKHLSIDYLGIGLLALCLGTLQVMLDRGQEDNWFNSHLITTLAVSAVRGCGTHQELSGDRSPPFQKRQFCDREPDDFRARRGTLRGDSADSAIPAGVHGLHRRAGRHGIIAWSVSSYGDAAIRR